MDTFPDRLKAARLAAGAIQSQWATLAGVDQSAYSLWESGTCRPLAENLARLAEAAHLCLACLAIGPQHFRSHHPPGASSGMRSSYLLVETQTS